MQYPDPRPRARAWLLLAVLVSAALAAWAEWPGPWDGTAVVGHWNHPDGLSNHWLTWWVGERVTSGQGLLHNRLYYWPVGDYPAVAGNANQAVLAIPFHLLFEWPR